MFALVRKGKVVSLGPTEASVEGHRLAKSDKVLPVETRDVPAGRVHTEGSTLTVRGSKVIETPNSREAGREDRREVRAAAYPSVGDQLDAIWKILGAIPLQSQFPEEACAVMLRVQAVKKENP